MVLLFWEGIELQAWAILVKQLDTLPIHLRLAMPPFSSSFCPFCHLGLPLVRHHVLPQPSIIYCFHSSIMVSFKTLNSHAGLLWMFHILFMKQYFAFHFKMIWVKRELRRRDFTTDSQKSFRFILCFPSFPLLLHHITTDQPSIRPVDPSHSFALSFLFISPFSLFQTLCSATPTAVAVTYSFHLSSFFYLSSLSSQSYSLLLCPFLSE